MYSIFTFLWEVCAWYFLRMLPSLLVWFFYSDGGFDKQPLISYKNEDNKNTESTKFTSLYINRYSEFILKAHQFIPSSFNFPHSSMSNILNVCLPEKDVGKKPKQVSWNEIYTAISKVKSITLTYRFFLLLLFSENHIGKLQQFTIQLYLKNALTVYPWFQTICFQEKFLC